MTPVDWPVDDHPPLDLDSQQIDSEHPIPGRSACRHVDAMVCPYNKFTIDGMPKRDPVSEWLEYCARKREQKERTE